MTEIDVTVSLGPTRVFNVLDTTTSELIVAAKAHLCGWSLRTTSVQSSSETESAVNTPVAGAVIATLALPQGEWTISWLTMLTGTPAAADANNFQLEQNAVTVLKGLNGTTVGQQYPQPSVTVSIPAGGQNVTVNAIGAANPGAIYFAQIIASPVGVPAIAEITSNGYPIAEIALGVGQVDTESFGPDGVEPYNDITITILTGSFRGAVYWRDAY